MVSGIPLILGLGTRMFDLCVYVGLLGPNVLAFKVLDKYRHHGEVELEVYDTVAILEMWNHNVGSC